MLPIVQRELQTAARNPRLFYWRIVSGAAVLFIILLLIVPLGRSGADRVFVSLSFIALSLCLLEGVRKTADAISFEKREGTLGLLFLSTLSGWDIIFGKLTSAAIRSLSTLLSFVPMLAVTLLMGGTTGGEFWRTILVLILTLLTSLSLCLCLSAITRDGALVASIIFIVALSVLPFASSVNTKVAEWLLPLSPFFTHWSASDNSYSLNARPYWLGIIYLSLNSVLSLAIASFAVTRSWQDRPVKARRSPRLSNNLSPASTQKRSAMLDRNPVMWLMFNPRSHGQFRIFLYLAVALIILGAAGAYFIAAGVDAAEFIFLIPAAGLAVIALVSSVRVARNTSRNFAEARANGALELLLSTPLKVRDILSGQWLAVRADILPALIIIAALSVVTFLFPLFFGGVRSSIWIVKSLAEIVLGLATIAAVGVWMGLTAKTPGRAFFRTIMLGLIAPHFICVPTLVIQLVLLLVALDKISANFRRFVAEQYLATPTLAAISPAPPNTPPVIR